MQKAMQPEAFRHRGCVRILDIPDVWTKSRDFQSKMAQNRSQKFGDT